MGVFHPVEALRVGKTFTEICLDKPLAAPSSKAVEDGSVLSLAPAFLLAFPEKSDTLCLHDFRSCLLHRLYDGFCFRSFSGSFSSFKSVHLSNCPRE
jgi:hypothetical protein